MSALLQDEDWNVERKADNSPLTRADQEANAVICAGLARIGRDGSKSRTEDLTRVYLRHRPAVRMPTAAVPALPPCSAAHPHRL
jgi:hypothetical protein